MGRSVIGGVRRWKSRAGRAARVARRTLRMRPELTIAVSSDWADTGSGVGPADVASVHAALAQTARARRFEVVATDAAGAARGDYVTVLRAGDSLTPDFVAAVLEQARPDRVVFAPVVRPGEQVPKRKADRAGLTEALGSVRGAVLPRRVAASLSPVGEGVDETSRLAETIVGAGLRPVMVAAGYVTTTRVRPDDGPSGGPDSSADAGPDVSAMVEAALAAIRRLDDLFGEDGSPVVAAAIGAATAPLNRALHADPSLRPELLRQVAGIRGFDAAAYGELNRGFGRDLAVLYAALPLVDTSANIAARRVREFGAIVDVVTADLTRKRASDPSAELLWRDLVDARLRVGGRGTVQGNWPAVGRFVRDGLAAVAAQEQRKGAYRSVYSRTMFPASHLLAAAYKLDHPDTPWLAEFSDPQLMNPYGEARRSSGEPDADTVALLDRLAAALRERGVSPPLEVNVWEWAETVTYALADTVLFTNDHQRDYMLGYCADPAAAGRAGSRALVSHHPSPPPDLYRAANPDYPLEAGCVHLAYFGTFYPTRTLTEVVDAFGTLTAAERARLRLHVFTNKPEALAEAVASAGLADVVVVGPYQPFTSYLALTTRFDVLVINDYRTSGELNPYLPAKYADYRGAGRPIWGVVQPGSVLDGLPLAHRSELGDVAGAADVLRGLAGRS